MCVIRLILRGRRLHMFLLRILLVILLVSVLLRVFLLRVLLRRLRVFLLRRVCVYSSSGGCSS